MRTNINKLSLTKRDVAKRQLETAIYLFLLEEDPVSIHTLAAASYNLIRDLSQKNGHSRVFVKDEVIDFARSKFGINIKKQSINMEENFFKHADRDPDNTIIFNAGKTVAFILEATIKYSELTNEFPFLFERFHEWFLITHYNILGTKWPRDLFNFYREKAHELDSLGRKKYFEEALSQKNYFETKKGTTGALSKGAEGKT